MKVYVRETVDTMIQNNLERKTLEKISCTQAINKIILINYQITI